ncbi:16456_t:CDS:2, partial [Gigaspora margarita]
KVFKNKYQRIHHSAQEQIPENLPHNAKGVQKQTPENSSYAKSAKEQIPENSLPNTKSVQGQTLKNSHNGKNAQGQIPEKYPRTNAKEFTQC